MNARTLVEYGVGLVVVIVVGSLLAGQVLGQPVLLGFVETGSMAPTLEPGDGFVAIPMSVAGPVEEGDVITFNAETLHGGGLTTHRVVGETEGGYITKGDANPVTDQAGQEPPVQREQIVAKSLKVGDTVVVIPQLGLLVTSVNNILSAIQRQLAVLLGTRSVLGTQGLAYILLAFGVGSYLLSELLSSGRRPQKRDTRRQTRVFDARLAIVGLTFVLIAVLTLSMTVPSGPQTFDVVSSQSDSPGPTVIEAGESENLTFVVPSNGMMPTVVFLEPGSNGVNVTPSQLNLGSGERKNATVTLHVPPETGSYQRTVIEHRYPAVLPPGTIADLYAVHPWLPIIVINLMMTIGFAGLATAIVGWGAIRVDARHNWSMLSRLRRWLR